MIYIVDARNNIGHPTKKHDMVGRLIRNKKAKVIKRLNKDVIIVQLLTKVFYKSETINCEFRIGIDPGYANIGFAVFKIQRDVITKLINGEVYLRTAKIKEGLDAKRMYRRSRRYLARKGIKKKYGAGNAKFKHPIWKNRSKHKFQVTHLHLIQSHRNVLAKLLKLVPIEQVKIHLEYNKFDIHKMITPKVQSFWYQKGLQFGFENVKSYVRNRDNYQCQICKKDVGKIRNEVHHITWKSNGGSDRPENLILLCENCHNKVHKNGLKCPKESTSVNGYRDAGVLNSVMKTIWNEFEDKCPIQDTYGYITSGVRNRDNIIKSHASDASLIAFNDSLGNQDLQDYSWKDYNSELNMRQFPRHTRSFTLRSTDRRYMIFDSIPEKKKKIVAWNRKRRAGQDPKKKSLTELKQSLMVEGKLNSTVIVAIPGKKVMRSLITDYKIRKGDVVNVESMIQVCKGVQNKGEVITFENILNPKKLDTFGIKRCRKLTNNCGLVTY